MAFHGAYSTFLTLYCRHHYHYGGYNSSISSRMHTYHNISTTFLYYLTRNRNRNTNYKQLSTSSESVEPHELAGKNAYDLLGLTKSCSFSEIKASFRKLAKETHPDLAQSPHGLSNSHRFVQILAAYQILSDTEKRAHYDRYLLSQKVVVQERAKSGFKMYTCESFEATEKQMEVVEWLKWYRYAINDIVSERRTVDGTGYFDVLENDFYSAINAAYYGPVIESIDFLPDSFEADVRSIPGTPEVLHLVSGRDLFGKVCIAKKFLELSHVSSSQSVSLEVNYGNNDSSDNTRDAYKDLELHVSGKLVAVANRVLPKSHTSGVSYEDCEDRIHVHLCLHEDHIFSGAEFDTDPEEHAVASKISLGTIIGLGTSGEEGSCFVLNNCGVKTHVIMIHRTLLVKHMHWYQLGDKASVCECRCTRARLPPSKGHNLSQNYSASTQFLQLG
ncbi:uncharacterized protein [Rutidosis leptorrhynchoides]|uniref:uncharacterized protein n=1 Tax=Rutidosis leptorrhynchoides TaxID=125765 RepID=UPI003A99796F